MSKVIISLLLYCLVNTSYSQTIHAVVLADSLLHAGTFKIAITGYRFPEEIKVLQDRALVNLKNHPEWKDKYIVKLMQDGAKDLDYKDAYGLTKEEFDKMLTGFRRGKDVFLSDTGSITIGKNNGIISFRSTGKFALLSYLRINTVKKVIAFDNLVVKREVKIDGKFYASTLHGVEAFGSEGTLSADLQKKVSYFGLAVGVNSGDTRPCLCFTYGRPGNSPMAMPEFLIVTIF